MSREIGQSRWYPWMINGALLVLALVSLAPLLWMLSVSFMPQGEASHFPPPLLPSSITTHNYHELFARTGMGGNFANSLLVSLAITLGSLLLNTMAGYAFAKLKFKGRGPLLVFIVATMAVPTQLGVVPLYLLMAQYGWIDTMQAIIVPALVNAFGVFWMTQYVQQAIPDEIIEAARVDGASAFRSFWSIALPIARPAATMLALFTFVATWTNFFWPFIVLTPQNPTLPVALSLLQANYFVDYSVVLAGTLVATVPLIILFVVAGKQLVSDIMQGAVKA